MCHLVGAAAAGVHPLAAVAELRRQAALDREVDVLVLERDLELARARVFDDAREFGGHGFDFGRLEDRRLDRHGGEHPHVGGGAHAVGLDEREVEDPVLPGGVRENLGVHRPDGRVPAHGVSAGCA